MIDRNEVKAANEDDAMIDRALAALGGATVPDGLQARVLMAAQTRMQAPSRRWAFPFPAVLATACVCGLALVAGTAIRQHHRTHDFRPVDMSRAESHSMPAVQTPATASMPLQMRRPAASATSRLRNAHPEPHEIQSMLAHEPRQAGEYDHPAPPLPLTEQEKLLLRIAHRGDPVEMAALDDAATRNLDFQAQKAQFDDFFYLHATETSDENQ